MEEATAHRKRPWFQLHLSTCVVLLFVAGALVWANMEKRFVSADHQIPYGKQTTDIVTYEYGWPIGMERYEQTYRSGRVAKHWVGFGGDVYGWILNTLIALSIVVAFAFVCELPFRRRERARAAQEPAP